MNLAKCGALALALLSFSATSVAQDASSTFSPSVKIDMDTRADFTNDHIHNGSTSSGIHGRYLNLHINGTITPKLSYSMRQRLNKFGDIGSDAFSATDWVYLAYRPTFNWEIAAGKQVVMIGGYEYDAAPIDVFLASNFWNNCAAFQFGASGAYITNDGRHKITFQVCNSPYQRIGESCFAYNLYWSGNMGWFQTMWSANLVEYRQDHYATFLSLGNRFVFDKFDIQVDLMNRATPEHRFWGYDYTVIGNVSYDVTPWLQITAKGGYDKLGVAPGADGSLESMPGTSFTIDHPFYGGGFCFFPFNGRRDIRLHAMYNVYHENNGDRISQINIGLKWRVNLFSKK